MSPAFAARRRAEQFDDLVEGTSTGPVDARYAELLELVGTLRETAPVEPRAAFVADLRERLLLAAETELAGAPAPSAVQDRLTLPKRSPRERRLAAVVGGFAIVGATTSMAVAAQSALPGDTLYPLKRAIENAQTGFSMDDEQKGSTLLANATSRLAEVDELTRADAQDLDVRTIQETLDTFTSQATEASDLLLAAYAADPDPQAIAELQDFTDQSFQSLNELAAVATDEVRDALVPVGNTLAAIEAAIQQACPSCADVLTSIPPWMLQAGQLADDLTGLIPAPEDVSATPPTTTKPGQGDRPGKSPVRGGGTHQTPSTPGSATGGGTDPVVPPLTGGGTATPGGAGGAGGAKSDPVKDLIDGISGGSSATDGPGLPVVGDVVEGVGEIVGGLTDPLKP